MQKILYITDREEYSEHNFIGPLFEKYLPKHLDIDVIYFTKFKSYFGRKDNQLVIPEFKKKRLFGCLEDNNIDVSSYDCVIVRNMHDVLEYVLDNKSKYNIKVGFRLSFPKITAELEKAKAENRSSLIQVANHKIKTYIKSNLIDRCDIFLPTSKQMQEVYYPNVKTKMFIIPSAIDPERIHEKTSRDDDKTVFAYNGTLSKLRNFEVLMEAFELLKKDNWELDIATKDANLTKSFVQPYKSIVENIKISKANTKEDLIDFISRCDVGLCLLPNIDLFNTSLHLKIINYYTSGIPALMSDNKQNRSIFTDEKDAWLCNFDANEIKNELEKIIDTPKEKIKEMGELGQKRLLEVRNYKVIAKQLSDALESLQ